MINNINIFIKLYRKIIILKNIIYLFRWYKYVYFDPLKSNEIILQILMTILMIDHLKYYIVIQITRLMLRDAGFNTWR